MKIAQLTMLSILSCLLGLVLLATYGLFSFDEIQREQQEASAMLALQHRINVFSTASDSMLLYPPDLELWGAYVAESQAIEQALLDLGATYPATHEVVNNIRRIRELLQPLATAEIGSAPHDGLGPLALTERSRLMLNQVAMEGVAMDAALGDALGAHSSDTAATIRRVVLQFSAAGVLFGAFCVIAFLLIHRRVTRPVLALTHTIHRLQSGDHSVRAPVHGDDELSQLSHSFNRLVDQVESRERDLLKVKDRYERAESVANLGSWEVDYATGVLHWSPGVFHIFALPEEGFGASEQAFFERIHPDDRDWFARRRAAWMEGHDTNFDEEHRIVRPDGSVRWVREIARIYYRQDGTPDYSTGIVQDITDRKEREQELGLLSARLQSVLEGITEGMLVIDHQRRLQFSNTTAATLVDEDRKALQQDPVRALTRHLGDGAGELLRQAKAENKAAAGEFFHPGTGLWLEVRVFPGEAELTLFIRDVSETHRAAEEVGRTLEVRKALINAIPAHIALIDGQGVIQDINEQWRQFARDNGFSGEDLGLGADYLQVCDAAGGDGAEGSAEMAHGLRELLDGKQEFFAMEYPCHSPERERWFRVMASRLVADQQRQAEPGAVVLHVDITERKLAERDLEKLAFHDSLTGLLTRNGFERELDRVLASGWQPEAMVVLLDIVGQRDINEAFGYAIGDKVLIEVSRRLAALEGAIVCRLGGDEFGLFVLTGDGVTKEDRRSSLHLLFKPKMEIGEYSVQVTARCGCTVLGGEQRSVDSLLAEAELALFRSPVSDDFTDMAWSWYSSRFEAQLRIREDLIEELRRATADGAFELHFQPKVRLRDGKLIGAEALIRWPHPRLGLQSPGVFIPLAEQSQLIGELGAWVLHEACRHLRDWQRQGLDIVRIAVNVSLQQFLVGDIVATVRSALEENELSPSALSLEITESVFGGESDVLHQKLVQLHEMGVRLSLDDFGTGYSSLLYLQRYPFDEIKIDQSFVKGLLSDGYCRQVVQTVLDLAVVLDAEVVAEGIESRDIGEALQALGCVIGQGYYYSMPLQSEDFRWLLEQGGTLPATTS